jgi:very-short-patch-repair endonuclease
MLPATELAKELRKRLTPAEKTLWARLRMEQFMGLRFRRQQPIGRYIADFYCDAFGLVVELDGPIHDQQQDRDAARDHFMNELGLTVWRVRNDDVHPDPGRFLFQLRRWVTQQVQPPKPQSPQ